MEEEQSRQCPVCGEEMEIQGFEDIEIDVCPSHGIWLDNGELEKIVQIKTSASEEQKAKLRLAKLRRYRRRKKKRRKKQIQINHAIIPFLLMS
jgi:Zn-finger nucleic acid-binding protein